MLALGLHLYHGVWSMLQTLGLSHPRWNRLRRGAVAAARRRRGRSATSRSRSPSSPASCTCRGTAMELERQRPRRARSTKKWDEAPLRDEAGEPGQQAEVHGHRGRLRPRRRRRPPPSLAELGYNVIVLLLPGQPAPRALASPPRAASTPPRTTRTTATASTACSTTRSRAATSAPARPTSTAWPRSSVQHHRPVRGPGRALRPRVRRHCSPTAPSAAPRSRAPSTPAARPASSCCSAPTRRSSGRSALGTVKMYPRHEMLDLVVVDGRARGIVTRDLVTGEIESLRRPTRWSSRTGGYGNVFYLVDQRQGLQRHRDLARLQEGRRLRQPLLHADPPDLHPGHRRLPVAS